jgi:hypothetical protein
VQAVGFLPEVGQDVLGNFADAVRMQQGLLVLCRTQLLFVLLGLDGLELRANLANAAARLRRKAKHFLQRSPRSGAASNPFTKSSQAALS